MAALEERAEEERQGFDKNFQIGGLINFRDIINKEEVSLSSSSNKFILVQIEISV